MKVPVRQLATLLAAAATMVVGLRVTAQNPVRTTQTGMSAPQRPATSASSAREFAPHAGTASTLPTFEDVTAKSGINFRHSFGEQKLSSIMEATGSGCAWIDYNNDGLLDLYVVSGRYVEGATKFSKPDGVDATNHLYRNNGDGTFTDVSRRGR
jgi:hypothetical protein